eukprot:scaffold119976_cov19-Tisochrysis_lutea.AAC.2
MPAWRWPTQDVQMLQAVSPSECHPVGKGVGPPERRHCVGGHGWFGPVFGLEEDCKPDEEPVTLDMKL